MCVTFCKHTNTKKYKLHKMGHQCQAYDRADAVPLLHVVQTETGQRSAFRKNGSPQNDMYLQQQCCS